MNSNTLEYHNWSDIKSALCIELGITENEFDEQNLREEYENEIYQGVPAQDSIQYFSFGLLLENTKSTNSELITACYKVWKKYEIEWINHYE